jgi:hypothetical protein
MKLLPLVCLALLFASSAMRADETKEVRHFLVTVDVIHEGKAVESRTVIDTNWSPTRRVPGEHVIRMDTTQYELYDGRRISVVVVADGVVKSVDGSRTLRAWKLVPGAPVKLHE